MLKMHKIYRFYLFFVIQSNTLTVKERERIQANRELVVGVN